MYYVDVEVDVIMVLRFYLVEIFFFFVWKGVVIVVLGGLVEVVFLFEIVLNGVVVFNYVNVVLL